MDKDSHFMEDIEPPGSSMVSVADHADNSVPFILRNTLSKIAKQSPLASQSVHHFPRFKTNPKTQSFRKKFFPGVTNGEWNDWHWQLRNRIRDIDTLSGIISLSGDEYSAIVHHSGTLPVSITPYYLSLIEVSNPLQPLRRSVVPVNSEYFKCMGETGDPLGEDHQSPVPGLVHRYPDRVLFLVTDFCSTYCRYCTRSRMVGDHGGVCNVERWQKAIDYISDTPSIRDVLISGGDPLTLSDEKLEWLLSRLRRIEHVEFIRIGTKVPAVLPQRITPALARMLKHYHPLWMSIHFTHPEELTPETGQACCRLADAGIPLGSQTVLLKGINDNVETMKKLMHGLLKIRVKPYYIYQCDPIPGSSHFRTPVEKGLEIIRGLRGHTTGYAVPTYVIDAPGGGGKIPVAPNYVEGQSEGYLYLKNYEGGLYRYPSPDLELALCS